MFGHPQKVTLKRWIIETWQKFVKKMQGCGHYHGLFKTEKAHQLIACIVLLIWQNKRYTWSCKWIQQNIRRNSIEFKLNRSPVQTPEFTSILRVTSAFITGTKFVYQSSYIQDKSILTFRLKSGPEKFLYIR